MENQPATGNYQIHLTLNLPNLPNLTPIRKLVPIIAILAILLFAALGPTLAFSTKLKSDGDAEYAKQNYAGALLKYEAAKNWWLPEKISPKLRDRDLEAKTAKTEIMIKSAENYTKGMEAFNNKQYSEAKRPLSLLALNDPHYRSAQDTLKNIEKIEEELSKPTPTPTPKWLPDTVSPQTASQTPVPKPTLMPQTPQIRMPDKPIIESFCDSRGNCVHSQFADQNSNSFLSSQPTVRVGETLSFTITVSGQETGGVLAFIITQGYDWLLEGGRKPWSTDLTYAKTFSNKDITTSQYLVYAYIKSQNDNYHRKQVCNWTDYPCDDSAQLQYTVLP